MTYLENLLEQSGYQMKTTFWQDFSIAEKFGLEAIRDTFQRAFNEWKTNVEYLTELILVLNWKIWYWYEVQNFEVSKLYNELWENADSYAMDNLKDEDLRYFLHTVD